ncbi:MAG: hypothetical protein JXA94_05820, partial [Parachlamydiales bacterium]|nr:hypothetical protein [Parachlamydiales bacterium]
SIMLKNLILILGLFLFLSKSFASEIDLNHKNLKKNFKNVAIYYNFSMSYPNISSIGLGIKSQKNNHGLDLSLSIYPLFVQFEKESKVTKEDLYFLSYGVDIFYNYFIKTDRFKITSNDFNQNFLGIGGGLIAGNFNNTSNLKSYSGFYFPCLCIGKEFKAKHQLLWGRKILQFEVSPIFLKNKKIEPRVALKYNICIF